MSDPYIYPLSDGTRAETLWTDTVYAFPPAERGVTPRTDASRSSVSSLTSPPKTAKTPEYRELRPAVLPSPHHLESALTSRVRNERDSHKWTAQQRSLNRITKQAKRYTCNQCLKSYAHAKNLREHKAKHQSERYPCEICGESVAEKRNLPRHKLLKHGIQHAPTTHSERNLGTIRYSLPRIRNTSSDNTEGNHNHEYDAGRDCTT